MAYLQGLFYTSWSIGAGFAYASNKSPAPPLVAYQEISVAIGQDARISNGGNGLWI